MDDEKVFLGTRMHTYDIKRQEGAPVIPCDACMGGMDAPWWIGFYIGDTLAYVICAADAVAINMATDTCSTCIPDPSDERVCDNCGKEYRRAAPAPVVTEVAA